MPTHLPPPKACEIIDAVLDATDITLADLAKGAKERRTAMARQLVTHLCSSLIGMGPVGVQKVVGYPYDGGHDYRKRRALERIEAKDPLFMSMLAEVERRLAIRIQERIKEEAVA
jgi:hypothetical protein